MAVILTGPQQTALTDVDAKLDDIFTNGIPGLVTGIQGYSDLDSSQKAKVKNIFKSVVAGMMAANVAGGVTQSVAVSGVGTLTFTNGILTSVA